MSVALEITDGIPDRLRNPRAEMHQRQGSVRRTVRLDMSWPLTKPGDPSGALLVRACSADTLIAASGELRELDSARMDVELAQGARVVSLESEPALDDAEGLIGRRAASGWRAVVHSLVTTGPLLQLLDDLPVAVLVSGYAGLRTGALTAMSGEARDATRSRMADICAGWSSESIALRTMLGPGEAIIPDTVPAPAWTQPDGDDGVLAAGSIRRERRVDVWREDDLVLEVEATFRDTWGGSAGEGILHEYALRARVDQGRVVSLVPQARVLPYPECPSAVSATQDLIGERISELSQRVPELLTGISSCTHLNDLLRSLAGVEHLAAGLV